ncbi:hypothetical protein [Streptomyces sp. NPDC048057]|uniref:hypothetical protein n=1 Tax=Streptomyces sp. NPDC048057 TaxID=3155628 RepID=UPI0033E82821
MGWSTERQAAIRFYVRGVNAFAALFVVLVTALTLSTGRHLGWLLVAGAIALWAGFTLFMRRLQKGQP